jgi:hypothetical protein
VPVDDEPRDPAVAEMNQVRGWLPDLQPAPPASAKLTELGADAMPPRARDRIRSLEPKRQNCGL